MNISKEERETIITYNEAEAVASVYTMNGALIRKLEGREPPRRGPAGQNLPGRCTGIRGAQKVGKGQCVPNFE